MSAITVIRNARHWRTGEPFALAFAAGRVIALEQAGAGAQAIDANGAVLAPGLVDVHVHLREPGQSARETIATGTRAAAAGGFTDVLCMPNTDPVLDTPMSVEWVRARAAAVGHARVHPIAAVSVGQKGERLAPLAGLAAAGAIAFSDDGRPVRSAALMRRALEEATALGRPVIAHEEDLDLAAGGVAHEGPMALKLGLPGIPPEAETVMVRRDIELAAATGGRLHLAHLSAAGSFEALRDAHRRGLAVSGEVCPHHFVLTDEALDDYSTSAKMNPPLRSEADRAAAVAAIADGTVDCLCTDHAPHTAEDKRQTFDRAPFGIVGLETALALTITYLVRPGHVTLARAIALWTESPRRLFGLPEATLEPGSPADLVLFDPDAVWTVEPERFFSKGRATPFAGWRLAGRVLATVCGGRVTHADEALAASPALQGSR
ncbi:MAG TPA: dihydroorotase [Candidatus Eisenbacteria bacterium]|nr:dihydroorotase [Candidatus Eisenbacteria bacterium]